MNFRNRLASLLVLLILIIFPSLAHAQESTDSAANPTSSVNDLIRILESEEARGALLDRLKAEAAAQESGEAGDANSTIARQVAEQTRAAAEQIVDGAEAVWSGLAALVVMFSDPSLVDFAEFRTLVINVILVGAGLFASYLVLRLLAHPLQRSLDRRAAGRNWSIRTALVLVATIIDILTVALAWGAGYLIALQLVGGRTGQMDINQTLLLNAFLVVEMIKVAMRLFLQARFPNLRVLPISDLTAAYWYFWLARVVSLRGFAHWLHLHVRGADPGL